MAYTGPPSYPSNAPAGASGTGTPRTTTGLSPQQIAAAQQFSLPSYAAGLFNAARSGFEGFTNMFGSAFGLGDATRQPTSTATPTPAPNATAPRSTTAPTPPPAAPATTTAAPPATPAAPPPTAAPGSTAPTAARPTGAPPQPTYSVTGATGVTALPGGYSAGIAEAQAPIDPTPDPGAGAGLALPTVTPVPGAGVAAAHQAIAATPPPGPTRDVATARSIVSERAGGADISHLDDEMVVRLAAGITDAETATGQRLSINSGYRSPEEQGRLYAEKKAINPNYPVAPAGKSVHNYGFAVDFNRGPAFDYLRENAGKWGLMNIGTAKNPNYDYPHIQIAGPRNVSGGAGSRFDPWTGAVDPFANATTYGAGGPARGGNFERDAAGNPVPPMTIPEGTPHSAGMENKNPGNLIYSGSDFQKSYAPGMVGPSKNLDMGKPQIVFDTQENGMTAAANLAIHRGTANGLNTVEKLIGDPKFGLTAGSPLAPGAIINISKAMGVKPGDVIDMSDPATAKSFMRAYINQEHGAGAPAYTDDFINAGVDRAMGITGGGAQAAGVAAPGGVDYSIPGTGFLTGPNLPGVATAPPAGQLPPAAAAAKVPTSGSLRMGASGPAVRDLQQQLKDAGYKPGPVDGRFGPRTRDALYRFQEAHPGTGNRYGLSEGIYGPKSRAALTTATAGGAVFGPGGPVVPIPRERPQLGGGYAAGLGFGARPSDVYAGPAPGAAAGPAVGERPITANPWQEMAEAGPIGEPPIAGAQGAPPAGYPPVEPAPAPAPPAPVVTTPPTRMPEVANPPGGRFTNPPDRLFGPGQPGWNPNPYATLQGAEEDRASRARADLPVKIADTYQTIMGGGGTDQFAGGPTGGLPAPGPAAPFGVDMSMGGENVINPEQPGSFANRVWNTAGSNPTFAGPVAPAPPQQLEPTARVDAGPSANAIGVAQLNPVPGGPDLDRRATDILQQPYQPGRAGFAEPGFRVVPGEDPRAGSLGTGGGPGRSPTGPVPGGRLDPMMGQAASFAQEREWDPTVAHMAAVNRARAEGDPRYAPPPPAPTTGLLGSAGQDRLAPETPSLSDFAEGITAGDIATIMRGEELPGRPRAADFSTQEDQLRRQDQFGAYPAKYYDPDYRRAPMPNPREGRPPPGYNYNRRNADLQGGPAAAGAAALMDPQPNGLIMRQVASLPPTEQAHYRDGFVNSVVTALNNGDRRAMLAQIESSPAARGRLDAVLGPQGASQLLVLSRLDDLPIGQLATALPARAASVGVDPKVAATIGSMLDGEDSATFQRGIAMIAANPRLTALVQQLA